MLKYIAHIGLTVSNLERSIQFYQNVLGLDYQGQMQMSGNSSDALFQKENCKARVAYLKSKDTDVLIELIAFESHEVELDQTNLFRTSISEICFGCDDIDTEYKRLKGMGVQFLSSPQTFDSTSYGFGKSRAVYFYDPDGNILEMIQSL